MFDLANLIIPKIRCYFYVKAPIKCIFYQINQASARIILVGKLSTLLLHMIIIHEIRRIVCSPGYREYSDFSVIQKRDVL